LQAAGEIIEELPVIFVFPSAKMPIAGTGLANYQNSPACGFALEPV
jgi:hypothetical protein